MDLCNQKTHIPRSPLPPIVSQRCKARRKGGTWTQTFWIFCVENSKAFSEEYVRNRWEKAGDDDDDDDDDAGGGGGDDDDGDGDGAGEDDEDKDDVEDKHDAIENHSETNLIASFTCLREYCIPDATCFL